MSGVRGVLAGSLGLIALQAVVSSDASAQRTGQLATGVAALINHAISPAVPLIPDLRATKTSARAQPSSATGTTSGGTGTASLGADQFSPNTRQVPKPAPATPPPVVAGTITA